jgi:hypothetical protein
MAPVFDLANHERDCPHYLSPYDVSDFLTFIAGAPLKKGDEVRCGRAVLGSWEGDSAGGLLRRGA